MGDFLVTQISENRSGSNSSSTSQSSSSQKSGSDQSQSTVSRQGEQTITDTTGNETRTQNRAQAEDTIQNGTQNKTSTSGQAQTRGQTQNTTQTRNLTARSNGQENTVEMADIGATVTFVIKIRGGLGTAPEGSDPPAPVCRT